MFNFLFEYLIQLCVILNCVLGIPIQLTTENATVADEFPYETQHAVCKVFTKEIEATAKATITRQLKGVCSSRDLNLRFDELHEELHKIKEALGILDHHTRTSYKNLDITPHNTEYNTNTVTTSSDLPVYKYVDFDEAEDEIKRSKKETLPRSKHENSSNQAQSNNAKLDEEISTFNDTVVESSEGDLYFYYWQIPEINKVLKRKNIYVTSPGFSVLGHTLHLQFYPNYMNEYIGMVLKPESNSFLKKHKIIYLGQTSTENKISSSILYGVKNEDKIFKIQPEMLSNDFISSGKLLIKIKIYLNL